MAWTNLQLVDAFRRKQDGSTECYCFAALGPVRIQEKYIKTDNKGGYPKIKIDVPLYHQSGQLNKKFNTSFGEDETVYAHLTLFQSKEDGKSEVGDRFNKALAKPREAGKTEHTVVFYGDMSVRVVFNKRQNRNEVKVDLTVRNIGVAYPDDMIQGDQTTPQQGVGYQGPAGMQQGVGYQAPAGQQMQNVGYQGTAGQPAPVPQSVGYQGMTNQHGQMPQNVGYQGMPAQQAPMPQNNGYQSPQPQMAPQNVGYQGQPGQMQQNYAYQNSAPAQMVQQPNPVYAANVGQAASGAVQQNPQNGAQQFVSGYTGFEQLSYADKDLPF